MKKKNQYKSDVTGVVLENDNVEFLKVNLSHHRLRRRVGGVKFMGITPSHPSDTILDKISVDFFTF